MTQYHIEIEIRDENGKLFPHPRGHGNFTGFKFIQEYRDYEAMNALFKLMWEELKMLMPKNQFSINAYSHNSISGTYMHMASYDEERGFLTH